MRIPYRKPGIYSQMKQDPHLTADKLADLERKLERLKLSKPAAMADVSRLAELGDFSENVEYQLAKGRLRGINAGIFNTQSQIDNSVLIENAGNTDKVQIGHTVTVLVNGKEKKYTILGSAESDPKLGVISHGSPLGLSLMYKEVGDEVKVKLADKDVVYKILNIA